MKHSISTFTAALILSLSMTAFADVERIDDGGQEIYITDYIPYNEAGVIVLYASWDVNSTSVADEVENWASTYPNLAVVIIDVGDTNSDVCRQFGVKEVPSIIILDINHKEVGAIVDNVDDMDEILNDEDLL